MYIQCTMMYMALHIADAEVNRLATALAKLDRTTKTEAVRRALTLTLDARRRAAKRKGFREFAQKLVLESRRRPVEPVTKQEIDDLWGMSIVDGN